MNKLFYGDNLEILRDHVADASVDLVYLDPPFNSNATYNVLFRAPTGEQSQAQIEAFDDTWHWNEPAEDAYWQVLKGPSSDAARMLEAMRGFLGENDMMAYLAMMAVRLVELRRVLKPTGSLYLHCDPKASHYLRVVLDAVFGKKQMRSEVIWKRTSSHSGAKRWGPVHDTIFFYTRSASYLWNRVFQTYDPEYVRRHYRHEDATGRFQLDNLTGSGKRSGDSGLPWRGIDPTERGRHWAVPIALMQRLGFNGELERLSTQEKLDFLNANGFIQWPAKGSMPRLKRYLDEDAGVFLQDVVSDIGALSAHAAERLGYPTQKPVALLERIIAASSSEGGLVLDPFCGCGTTIHAAEKLGRRWIGIDITHLAISLIERRMREAFPGIAYEVIGVPKDFGAAEALATRDKHEFEKWAITLIPDAQPWKGSRKGSDTGIDGIVYLRTGKVRTDKAIVEVKGGETVGVDVVHKLKSVIEREKALCGLLVTLREPSRQAVSEAASAGFAEIDMGTGTARFPRIQILTVGGLIAGTDHPRLPIVDSTVFKKARREERTTQEELEI